MTKTNVIPIKPMTIKCFEKEVYGNVHIYVEDAMMARMFGVLTKKKTLDYRDLEALQNLGFTIDLQRLPARKERHV